MKCLIKRIERLESELGCASETAFDRRLKYLMEAGLNRVREYRGREADEDTEIEMLVNGRRPRTLTEILLAGRERARLQSLAEPEDTQGETNDV